MFRYSPSRLAAARSSSLRGAVALGMIFSAIAIASPGNATVTPRGFGLTSGASSSDGITTWGDPFGSGKYRFGSNTIENSNKANGKTDKVKIKNQVASDAVWGDNSNTRTDGIFDPTKGSYHMRIDRSVELRKGATAADLQSVTTGAAAGWEYDVNLTRGTTLTFTYDVVGANRDGTLGNWEFRALGGMFDVSTDLVSSWMGADGQGSISVHLDPGSYLFDIDGGAFDAGAVEGTGTLDAFFTWSLTEDAAAPAVPEPASWAMMLGGFGLIGGTMRARRNYGGARPA